MTEPAWPFRGGWGQDLRGPGDTVLRRTCVSGIGFHWKMDGLAGGLLFLGLQVVLRIREQISAGERAAVCITVSGVLSG